MHTNTHRCTHTHTQMEMHMDTHMYARTQLDCWHLSFSGALPPIFVFSGRVRKHGVLVARQCHMYYTTLWLLALRQGRQTQLLDVCLYFQCISYLASPQSHRVVFKPGIYGISTLGAGSSRMSCMRANNTKTLESLLSGHRLCECVSRLEYILGLPLTSSQYTNNN